MVTLVLPLNSLEKTFNTVWVRAKKFCFQSRFDEAQPVYSTAEQIRLHEEQILSILIDIFFNTCQYLNRANCTAADNKLQIGCKKFTRVPEEK